MVKGKQLQLFVGNSGTYSTLGYSTANGLSYTNDVTTVSSKDHGKYPENEVNSASWQFTGTCLFSVAAANTVMGLAESGAVTPFAFGMISESDWQDGLKSVTGKNTNTSWSPGNSFIKYGSGRVTSCSITANDGENATLDLTITGSGALSSTAPVAQG